MSASPPHGSDVPTIRLNDAHETVVGRILLVVFFLVSAATTDVMMGMSLFVLLCASMIVFYPVMLGIRSYCYRNGISTWPRRRLMLAAPLALAFWFFLEMNRWLHHALEFHH